MICAALVVSVLPAISQAADLLPERGATERVGNWFFKSLSEAQLNAKTEELNARVVDLEVVSTSPMRFSAALVQNKGPHTGRWWWRFGLSQRQVNEITREKDARLIDVEVYRVGNRLRYAIVMKRDTSTGWFWFVDQTTASLKEKYRDKNMRLIDVERYRHNGRTRFAAIMVDNTGANERRWAWFVGRTPAQITDEINRLNLRVLDLDRHGSGSDARFDVVMAEIESGKQGWWYYYGITPKDAALMTRRHGARVFDMEPAGNGRFDMVMLNNGIAKSGHCRGKLAHAVRKVEATMKRYAIPGAQIAVARGDRLVMSCALGTADLGRNQKVKPDSLFRVMSVSKLITAAAVRNQASEGKYRLSDRMLDALGSRAPDGTPRALRMRQVKVEHLMAHRAGFYNNLPYDPMVSQTSVAADMNDAPPLKCREIAEYAVEKFPLGFVPGIIPSSVDQSDDEEFDAWKRRAYSNLGYCILQQIVAEHDSGTYQQIVKRKILKPAGITAMRIGKGRLVDRAEGEVRYYDLPFASKVSSQYANVTGDVPRPYSYVVEAMAAHGGWLASANDLVRFARFAPSHNGGNHSGGLNGTSSVLFQRDGATVAIIFNASPKDPDDTYDIFGLARSVINDTSDWPTRNLWANYGYPN